MRHFKRSQQTILCVIMLILVTFCIATAIVLGNYFVAVCSILSTYAILAILIVIIPSNFDYHISFDDCLVTFEMSSEDHRVITRSFSIVCQTRSKIVLDDGISRIPISYNKEVLEFLNEIKI